MNQYNHSWDFCHPDGPPDWVGTNQKEEKSEGLRTSRWDEIWQNSMMRWSDIASLSWILMTFCHVLFVWVLPCARAVVVLVLVLVLGGGGGGGGGGCGSGGGCRGWEVVSSSGFFLTCIFAETSGTTPWHCRETQWSSDSLTCFFSPAIALHIHIAVIYSSIWKMLEEKCWVLGRTEVWEDCK